MGEVGDVLNPIVKQAPKAKPINVLHMEVVTDVLNPIVKPVLEVKPINVKDMVVVTDVPIVLIGLTVDVVHPITMAIVLLVSKKYFQTMNEVKLYIDIPKK